MLFVLLTLVAALACFLMAAPTVTTRTAQSGFRLEEGKRCLVAFSLLPSLAVWEMDVGMPGYDGGERIDITVQANVLWRTYRARQVMEMTPFDVKCAYNPLVYTQLLTIINNDTGSITNSMFDGSTIAFWGYLQKAVPDPHVEGQMPTMTLTIVPTNYDPVNRVESGPLITEVAGT